MSRTLNLADRLLAMGRHLQDVGRTHDAVRVLTRLLRLADVPATVAEETQALLAELHLRQRRYFRARRHLAAALAYQPRNARYHYLMATALDDDEKGDDERALDHYRRSIRADAEQPECLGDFGLLALGLGHDEEGLAALRRAAELAPDDPDTLAKLVEGLCQLDRVDEARSLLREARFRHGRDRRFEKLWNDFQFQQVHAEQQAGRWVVGIPGEDGGPVILPFARPRRRVGRKVVRTDPPEPVAPPHIARPTRRQPNR